MNFTNVGLNLTLLLNRKLTKGVFGIPVKLQKNLLWRNSEVKSYSFHLILVYSIQESMPNVIR